MIDPNENEQAALQHAALVGGEYVESLGRTDLALWSASEWQTLVDVAVTAFLERLRQIEPIPF